MDRQLQSIKLLIQYCLPQRWLSLLAGKAAYSRQSWFKNWGIDWLIKRYQINWQEGELDNWRDYPSVNAFFTRRLRPGVRAFPHDDTKIASPVDGVVSESGKVVYSRLTQIKGSYYTVSSLLGDQQLADRFINGSFATMYLAPHNYHRVHMPCAGTLVSMTYIPGRLLAVNPASVQNVEQLFARNERVVCVFDTSQGLMSVVLVGALFVGSIATSWHGIVCPPHGHKIQHWRYDDSSITLSQGDELGHFEFGSTIVLLTASQVSWSQQASSGSEWQLGQVLGRLDAV